MSLRCCKNCYWIWEFKLPYGFYIGVCGNYHSSLDVNTLKKDIDYCGYFETPEEYEAAICSGNTQEPERGPDVSPKQD